MTWKDSYPQVHKVMWVHAHPDDETLSTGALIVASVQAGAEAMVITATRGEQGEIVEGSLPEGTDPSTLRSVREGELAGALAALGVQNHAYLGTPPARAAGKAARDYEDSGMQWVTPTVAGPGDSAGPDSFTSAGIAEAVEDLVSAINDYQPDLLVTYDSDGGYGHPDHVRAHEIAVAAAHETGVPLEVVTLNEGPRVSWFDLPETFDSVASALNSHRTQLTVDGRDVIHSGGQREAIVTAAGLRRIS